MPHVSGVSTSKATCGEEVGVTNVQLHTWSS